MTGKWTHYLWSASSSSSWRILSFSGGCTSGRVRSLLARGQRSFKPKRSDARSLTGCRTLSGAASLVKRTVDAPLAHSSGPAAHSGERRSRSSQRLGQTGGRGAGAAGVPVRASRALRVSLRHRIWRGVRRSGSVWHGSDRHARRAPTWTALPSAPGSATHWGSQKARLPVKSP